MNVGFVGLGARINKVARLLWGAKPELVFRAYTDPSPVGLKDIEALNGHPMVSYGNLKDMLKYEDINLLMIGSPNFLHFDHLKIGLRSEVKYIFVEKPVVISEETTFKLLELLREFGGHERVIVGLVLRFSKLYMALRKSLDKGQLGDIVSIQAAENIAPYHGSFFMRDWRRFTHNSGGFMLEKCCHDLDIYQSIVGFRPNYVSSFGGRKFFVKENRPTSPVKFVRPEITDSIDPFTPRWGGIGADFESDADIVDYQTALVEYENNTTLCFHSCMFASDEVRNFSVIGTKGMAQGDFKRNYFALYDNFTSQRILETQQVSSDSEDHYGADKEMAIKFAGFLEQEDELPVGVVDALEAGITALKIDEARLNREIVDMRETWEEFDSYL